MEMLFVPEVSMVSPGVKRAMPWMSLMPLVSMSAALMAVMLMGTLLALSSRRVAVTVTSCSIGPWSALAVDAEASAASAAGMRRAKRNSAAYAAAYTGRPGRAFGEGRVCAGIMDLRNGRRKWRGLGKAMLSTAARSDS